MNIDEICIRNELFRNDNFARHANNDNVQRSYVDRNDDYAVVVYVMNDDVAEINYATNAFSTTFTEKLLHDAIALRNKTYTNM